MELLDKKGAIYSDRPRLPVAGEIMGWERAIGLHRYNSRLKHLRKLLVRAIGTRHSLAELSGSVEHEASGFLYRVMNAPETLAKQVHRCASSLWVLSEYQRISVCTDTLLPPFYGSHTITTWIVTTTAWSTLLAAL